MVKLSILSQEEVNSLPEKRARELAALGRQFETEAALPKDAWFGLVGERSAVGIITEKERIVGFILGGEPKDPQPGERVFAFAAVHLDPEHRTDEDLKTAMHQLLPKNAEYGTHRVQFQAEKAALTPTMDRAQWHLFEAMKARAEKETDGLPHSMLNILDTRKPIDQTERSYRLDSSFYLYKKGETAGPQGPKPTLNQELFRLSPDDLAEGLRTRQAAARNRTVNA
jgi:hypothetical protein